MKRFIWIHNLLKIGLGANGNIKLSDNTYIAEKYIINNFFFECHPAFALVFFSGVGAAIFALLLTDIIRTAYKAPATPLEAGNIGIHCALQQCFTQDNDITKLA